MSNFRTEHDSLGEVAVPKTALYGAQTQRAINNFQVSGRTGHPALLRAYLRLKAAAAQANQQAGVLDEARAQAIVQAADKVLSQPVEGWGALFPVDPYQAGAGTSQNMNTNEVLANVANQQAGGELGSYHWIHPNDHVNRSQSTNDTYPTVMRLALLEDSRELLVELKQLAESFAVLGQRWNHLPKSGRTHLQDAVPMRLGQEFAAYGVAVHQCAGWITQARGELLDLGIGGSAVGTGLNVPAGYVPAILIEIARLTGDPVRGAPNLVAAMQSQAPVALYSSMLRVACLELTRICNDLRLLASGPMTGLSEILLPAVQPGSSIMPGKVNPSIIEMANQTWFSVLGYDQTVAYAMQAGQLELNVMMPMMAYATLEATRVFTHATRILRTLCLDGMQANEPRLRKFYESTPQIATALSPRLGYEKVAELVKEAVQTERSVVEIVRERQLIPEAELLALIDVNAVTGPG